jgi:hypothetical protein
MHCPQAAWSWAGCRRAGHDRGLGLDGTSDWDVNAIGILASVDRKVYAINGEDGKPDGEGIVLLRMSGPCSRYRTTHRGRVSGGEDGCKWSRESEEKGGERAQCGRDRDDGAPPAKAGFGAVGEYA